MRNTIIISSILFLAGCSTFERPRVRLETPLGDIIIEVIEDRATVTAANFLRYVDEGRWGDAHFYRVVRLDNQPRNDVKIEVIQGGLGPARRHPDRLPPVAHESTRVTGIRHRDGVVSMAREAPGTESSEFFICIGDQPGLDFGGRRNPDGLGFSAFGRVIDGMEVVRRIQIGEDRDQYLLDVVPITRVERLRADPPPEAPPGSSP